MAQSLVILEYYQPVILHILQTHQNEIQSAVTADRQQIRHGFWPTCGFTGEVDSATGWQLIDQYLRHLEAAIQTIVRRHSVFYWIHLYRRLGVSLPPQLYLGKTDHITLALVRRITETSFVKYGSLDRDDDIRQSSDVSPNQVFGGLYEEAMLKYLNSDRQAYDALWARMGKQWVIVDFIVADYIDLFRVEGLAYEYWHATALMRAIGKGAKLYVNRDGEYYSELRTDELDFLIRSYDKRIERLSFTSTHTGISFNEVARISWTPNWGTMIPKEVSHEAQGLYEGIQTRSGTSVGEFGARGRGNGSRAGYPQKPVIQVASRAAVPRHASVPGPRPAPRDGR